MEGFFRTDKKSIDSSLLVMVFPVTRSEEHVSKLPGALRKVAPYLNIGGMFAGCMVVGTFLGHWLDGKFGTKPWLLLAGAFLGMASGFYHFFKVVLRMDKRSKDSESDQNE